MHPHAFLFSQDTQGNVTLESEGETIALPPLNRYIFFLPAEGSAMLAATNRLIPAITGQMLIPSSLWLSTWAIPDGATGRARELIEKRCAELDAQHVVENWQIERSKTLTVATKPYVAESNVDYAELWRVRWRRLFLLLGLPAETTFLPNPTFDAPLHYFAQSRFFAPTQTLLTWLYGNSASVLYPVTTSLDRIALVFLTPHQLHLSQLQTEQITAKAISDSEARILWSTPYE